jgi:hypothetical protein
VTLQTKQFIELPDISGLQFTCKNCKATISLLLSGQITITKLRSCPLCLETWLSTPEGSTIETVVAGLVSNVQKLQGLLHGEHRFPAGCTIELEIREGVIPSGVSRASNEKD